VGVQTLRDALVAGHHDALEEVDRDDRPVLEADVFPPAGVIEVDLAEDLVERAFDHPARSLHHVFDHVGIIVAGIGEPLEGEKVADRADHRAAVDAERIVTSRGVLRLEILDVQVAGGVVHAEALFLHALQSSGVVMEEPMKCGMVSWPSSALRPATRLHFS